MLRTNTPRLLQSHTFNPSSGGGGACPFRSCWWSMLLTVALVVVFFLFLCRCVVAQRREAIPVQATQAGVVIERPTCSPGGVDEIRTRGGGRGTGTLPSDPRRAVEAVPIPIQSILTTPSGINGNNNNNNNSFGNNGSGNNSTNDVNNPSRVLLMECAPPPYAPPPAPPLAETTRDATRRRSSGLERLSLKRGRNVPQTPVSFPSSEVPASSKETDAGREEDEDGVVVATEVDLALSPPDWVCPTCAFRNAVPTWRCETCGTRYLPDHPGA